jgi:indole-3-glycerol phosphate synthase/phosphoribosylanthranilate isomerase
LPRSCEIWKAVRVDREPAAAFDAADRLLFDNGEGGTGQSFEWDLVRAHPNLAEGLVAGGIGPHNAAQARSLGAYAIDVGSRVEDAPGRKSPEKIRALFDALRSPCREPVRACA